MSTGIQLIADERNRQIEEEGWTAEHDARHKSDELAIAAACYAVAETRANVTVASCLTLHHQKDAWPWNNFDKRRQHNRLRQLAIAGALIAAEIDRLQGPQDKLPDPIRVLHDLFEIGNLDDHFYHIKESEGGWNGPRMVAWAKVCADAAKLLAIYKEPSCNESSLTSPGASPS